MTECPGFKDLTGLRLSLYSNIPGIMHMLNVNMIFGNLILFTMNNE
jgi:hypothetical protein